MYVWLFVWLCSLNKKDCSVTLNRTVLISSLHYTTYILHCLFVCLFVCLSHWFALSTMCLMPLYPFLYYSFLFLSIFLFYVLFLLFSTCPYLYICNSCIFVYVYIYIYYLICTYQYFCVLLFVFSVICMHQGVRE